MRLASDYKHLHRCPDCAVVSECFDHDCIGAGSTPPPEGYLVTCDKCAPAPAPQPGGEQGIPERIWIDRSTLKRGNGYFYFTEQEDGPTIPYTRIHASRPAGEQKLLAEIRQDIAETSPSSSPAGLFRQHCQDLLAMLDASRPVQEQARLAAEKLAAAIRKKGFKSPLYEAMESLMNETDEDDAELDEFVELFAPVFESLQGIAPQREFCYAEGDEGLKYCGDPESRHCPVLGDTDFWKSAEGQRHLVKCMRDDHLIHHAFVASAASPVAAQEQENYQSQFTDSNVGDD